MPTAAPTQSPQVWFQCSSDFAKSVMRPERCRSEETSEKRSDNGKIRETTLHDRLRSAPTR
jgi:hypothetical protein